MICAFAADAREHGPLQQGGAGAALTLTVLLCDCWTSTASDRVRPVATGVQGGLVIAVGTHEPAVELLLLRPAASPLVPPSLVPLGRLGLVPPPPPPLLNAIANSRQQRRRALLAAALGLDAEEGGSSGSGTAAGAAAQQRGSIPESVQLLPSAGSGTSCEVRTSVCVQASLLKESICNIRLQILQPVDPSALAKNCSHVAFSRGSKHQSTTAVARPQQLVDQWHTFMCGCECQRALCDLAHGYPDVQVLVGLRSGALLRAVAQPAATAAGGSGSGGSNGGEEDMADAEVEFPGAEALAGAVSESWDLKQVGMQLCASLQHRDWERLQGTQVRCRRLKEWILVLCLQTWSIFWNLGNILALQKPLKFVLLMAVC